MIPADTDPYPIHEANEQELKEAISVRIRVFVDIQKFMLEEEIDEYDKAAMHLVVVDASQDNKVIGTLRVYESEGSLKIGRVVILPEHQGKGLGKKLMLSVEQHLAMSPKFGQYTHVKLGSQCDKRVFYEKCGYVAKEDEVYYEQEVPHIWMYKKINFFK
ncbi:hypothetical protein GGH99_002686 [Coemansia sp. RSA 1285]|nr:hypothetical protein EV177_006992 [Coemansia sp. RSA 1804]KAJ2690111.1 hypothetical protein GGH99_002686 [Coemansia sp. RSA 1285]